MTHSSEPPLHKQSVPRGGEVFIKVAEAIYCASYACNNETSFKVFRSLQKMLKV